MPSSSVAIAMYHAVVEGPPPLDDWCFLPADAFRAQIRRAREWFDIIPLADLHTYDQGHSSRPLLAVTFDDGFRNNATVALSILEDEQVHATVFLTTGLIGTSDTVWFCRLIRAIDVTTRQTLRWSGTTFELGTRNARKLASRRLQARLKEFPHPRLIEEVRTIVDALGDDPDATIELDSPYAMLQHRDLDAMLATGLIAFGAHTHSHAILGLLPAEAQRHEITRSFVAVEALSGRRCTMFAYPNGGKLDYNSASLSILSGIGATLAVTAIEGVNDGRVPPLELMRFGIGNDPASDDFERLLASARAG